MSGKALHGADRLAAQLAQKARRQASGRQGTWLPKLPRGRAPARRGAWARRCKRWRRRTERR
ncbi:hypothetical protein [Pedomonas mirosovicensis]|uniref:hypothetical protein n=1 Tax=Pedomonas mirosovicensis TaxID=2908641 RepID=UPI002167808A|nr:hypothetical protein [Pedomonas mirosovicensis]MCH8684857.1 hypothetical protein [Pedomonas mirosovicensis]